MVIVVAAVVVRSSSSMRKRRRLFHSLTSIVYQHQSFIKHSSGLSSLLQSILILHLFNPFLVAHLQLFHGHPSLFIFSGFQVRISLIVLDVSSIFLFNSTSSAQSGILLCSLPQFLTDHKIRSCPDILH